MSPLHVSPRLYSRLLRMAGDRIAKRKHGQGRLCILNYHRILQVCDPFFDGDPDVVTFRWQMELLAECFNVLPLAEAVAALPSGDLPPRAVCVTFDDGYKCIYDLALPILKEFKIPATVFVTSGYVGNGNMWNDTIIDTIRRIPTSDVDLRDIGLGKLRLGSVEDKKRAAKHLTHSAKYLAPPARLTLTKKLESIAGDTAPSALMLSEQMLASLIDHGIEIGAHTVTHPILLCLDDESARYEIIESKRQLEAMTGTRIHFFAYPNGKAGIDFDERHVRMVQEAGYLAAFSSLAGTVTRTNDLFQIPRSLPWDSTPIMFGARILHWLMGEAT